MDAAREPLGTTAARPPRELAGGNAVGVSRSAVISLFLCSFIVLGFAVANPRMAHWFVLPVWACGVLMGRDAVDYARGRRPLFDPVGIVGVVGVLFFFLAPLLHVHWDQWMRYVEPPQDWRPWLGAMAFSNVAGIALYRWALGFRRPAAATRTYWVLDSGRFLAGAGVVCIVAMAAQLTVYRSKGGILGLMTSVTERGSLDGAGWLVALAEPLPIVVVMAAAVLMRCRGRGSALFVAACLGGYFVLGLLFGGLRGSRANTIWGLFWAAGILHQWVRPLRRSTALAGIAAMLAFMYAYGFYKDLNVGAVAALSDVSSLAEAEQASGRTFRALILGDLARSDVQAFLLYRVARPGSDYVLRYGQTYAADLVSVIPRGVWPGRPPGKVRAGTEAMYGAGVYDANDWRASNQYGLAGDALLNFGPAAMALAYVALGLYVGWVRNLGRRLRTDDSRRLLLPLLVIVCFWMLVSDTDNLVWVLVKDGLIPALLVLFASRRYVSRPGPQPVGGETVA